MKGTYSSSKTYQTIHAHIQQEYIPVGCVPSAH